MKLNKMMNEVERHLKRFASDDPIIRYYRNVSIGPQGTESIGRR